MASYSIVHDLETDEARFAIVATEAEVHYVFPPGREMSGMDDKRIERLVKARKSRQPLDRETPWTKLAMTNVGYFYAKPLVETQTLEEATAAALEILSTESDDTVTE